MPSGASEGRACWICGGNIRRNPLEICIVLGGRIGVKIRHESSFLPIVFVLPIVCWMW
jgi:hypothetical protein